MGPTTRIDASELSERAMWSTVLSVLPNLIALLNRLIVLFGDNRMIALGEQQAEKRALERQSKMLRRAKTIENDVATRHRRHVDDSAFDSSFERGNDA